MQRIPESKPIIVFKKKSEKFPVKNEEDQELQPSGKYCNHPYAYMSEAQRRKNASSFPVWNEATRGSGAPFSENIFDNISQISDGVQSADVSHYRGN